MNSFELKVSGAIAAVGSFFSGVRKDFMAALGFAEHELPTLEKLLVVSASVLTVAFPEAGALEAYLLDAASVVKKAEDVVVRLDGTVQPHADAIAEGHNEETLTKASSEQKRQYAQEVLSMGHTAPASIHNLAIEATVSASKHQ